MCGLEKPETEFSFRSLETGERQDHCRACHAAYRRQHYLRTKATYIENERLRVKGHRERNRELLREYLLGHPCVDCGEKDPVVLDFDHRDPATKRLEVAKLAAKKPWPVVLVEIAKCDVRCVNCHRLRTASQFGWRRATMAAIEDAPLAPLPVQVRLELQSTEGIRICRTCGVAQPLSEFALKNERTGSRSTQCRSCQRTYAKEHYARNRDVYLRKAKRRNSSVRDRFARFLIAYFRDHPCVDCGVTDPRILEFDHREGVEKLAAIATLLKAQAWDAMIAEIAKCDVRCASCHRRKTARQFGWERSHVRGDVTEAA